MFFIIIIIIIIIFFFFFGGGDLNPRINHSLDSICVDWMIHLKQSSIKLCTTAATHHDKCLFLANTFTKWHLLESAAC